MRETDLSAISWAGHIMRCKSHGYADEEEKANCSASGSGPRAAASTAAHFLRKHFPGNTGLQHEQDASQNGAIVERLAPRVSPGIASDVALVVAATVESVTTIRHRVLVLPWPPRQRNNEEVNRACSGLTAPQLILLELLSQSWCCVRIGGAR